MWRENSGRKEKILLTISLMLFGFFKNLMWMSIGSQKFVASQIVAS